MLEVLASATEVGLPLRLQEVEEALASSPVPVAAVPAAVVVKVEVSVAVMGVESVGPRVLQIVIVGVMTVMFVRRAEFGLWGVCGEKIKSRHRASSSAWRWVELRNHFD